MPEPFRSLTPLGRGALVTGAAALALGWWARWQEFVQLGIVGPLLVFFATAPLRRTAPPALAQAMNLTTEQVVEHVQRVALLTLEGRHE